MSPFKSTKLGILSNSVKYILDRDDRVGAAITTTSTNHVWSYGDYNYICFLSPGTFTVQRSGKIDYCLVGGGGGGGGGYVGPPFTNLDGGGGGGGAGGMLHNYNYDTAEGTYTVNIGSGGNGGAAQSVNNPGFAGSPTTITGPGITPTEYFTAYGGGGGSGAESSPPYIESRMIGASAGAAYAAVIPGNLITGQPALNPIAPYRPDGIVQGNASGTNSDGECGGGGGGAGSAGSPPSETSDAGRGGDGRRVFAGDAGLEPANTPASLTIGEAAHPTLNLEPGRYLAGGGSGGGTGSTPSIARSAGGGGVQGPGYSVINIDAIQNTGSGGSGGMEINPPGATKAGGNGASGIVILRYKRVVDGG